MRIHVLKVLVVVIAFALPTIAQPLPTATPESVGISSERLNTIAVAMEREIEQDRMPGAVVAIARRGKLVYYESFGYLDKEARIPMRKDAIFALASMTKPIFAAAAMKLYEEGRLLMDQPVGVYLPELSERQVATNDDGSQTEPSQRQPTIEDLMRHTSGFVDRSRGNSALHGRYPDGRAEMLSGKEYLSRLADLPLRYEPGTTFEYGPGFNILGLAIERVTGQAIYSFLKDVLFEPMGLEDTSFTIPASKAERQAKVLPIDPITGRMQTTRNQSEPLGFDCGSGCLASTAADYLAFAQMLLNGGTLNGVHVLGPRTVEYMTSDHAGPDIDLTRLYQMRSMPAYGYGYGLGGAVRRGPGLGGRTGSPGEYMWGGSQGTYFWVDPREELVVVHMAQTPGDIRGYYRQLIPSLVYQAIVD
jgi:CubicO group peptidase (beta-lactamase class C family)